MTRRRLLLIVCAVLLFTGVAAYLHDPPWAGGITAGMRDWEEDPPGTRFRWTSGHANLFVPSDATAMTLPLRAGWFPGRVNGPVTVEVSVDDRWLATIDLRDPNAWERRTLPLPRRPSHRRFRRVDLRVSRVVGFYNLGVQVGPIALERP